MYSNRYSARNNFIYVISQPFSCENGIKKSFVLGKALFILLLMFGSMLFVQGLNSVNNQSSADSNQTKDNVNSQPFVHIPTSGNGNNQGSNSQSAAQQFTGFVVNTGQNSDPNVKYIAHTSEYTIYFENSQILFNNPSSSGISGSNSVLVKYIGSQNVAPSGFRLDPAISKLDSANTQNLAYQEIWYYNLYPHIDLKYYMTNLGLKYEFIVKPGGNPANILIHLDTLGSVHVLSKDLIVYSQTNPNSIIYSDSDLKTYQGYDQVITSSFNEVPGLKNTFSFNIGNYNNQQLLFIDPYVSVAPITILQNSDFYNYTILDGVTGTGTATDPYIFNNLNITSNADNTPGILITNTNLYFIIENCYFAINGTNSPSIDLESMSNGVVENNIIANYPGASSLLNKGIYVISSPNTNISSNTIPNRYYGVQIANPTGNNGPYIVFNNTITNTTYAIWTATTINLKVDLNHLVNDSNGIYVATQSLAPQMDTITNNILNSTIINGYGIQVFGNNTLVTGNQVYGFGYGIYTPSDVNLTIENNYVYDSYNANFYIYGVYNSTYTNNHAYNGAWGLLVGSTTNVIISNNVIANSTSKGISLSSTNVNLQIIGNNFANFTQTSVTYIIYVQSPIPTGLLITGNQFSGAYYGIYLTNVSNAVISGNTFTGCFYGINSIYSVNNVISVNVFSSTTYAIYLSSVSNNNYIYSNSLTSGASGIYITYSDSNLIYNNNVTSYTQSIVLALQSKLNSVYNNNIISNIVYGVYVIRCTNNSVFRNQIINGALGIYLEDANYTLVTNNYISGNIYQAVKIINSTSMSLENIIKFNDFVNNYPSNPQIYDNGTYTVFLFNYYSDHPNIDSNGDGIADTPYPSSGTNTTGDLKPSATSIYNTEKILGIQVLFPNGGENLNGIVIIQWNQGEDSFGYNNITYAIYYSANGGSTWNTIATLISGNNYQWDSSALSTGNYLIKITASNGLVANSDASDATFSVNALPLGSIVIKSDSDFATYAIAGDGNAGNPYLIQKYFITGTSVTAIYIANTTAYFILEYNILTGLSSTGIYGIYLYNVTHGTIYNNTISYFDSGIFLENSSLITINGNYVFANNNAGIYLKDSDYNTITSNYVYNNMNYGILLENSSNNNLEQNEVYLTGFSYVPYLSTMSENSLHIVIGSGIAVDPSTNNNLTNNIIYNNYYTGVQFEQTDSSYLTGNNIYNNQGNGIDLLNSSYNSIQDNFIFENGNTVVPYFNKPSNTNIVIGSGIAVDPSTNNKILNNIIYANTLNGITIQSSAYTLVMGNVIYDHSGYGLTLDASTTYTNVTLNEFFNNNLAGTSQASDNGLNNVFNHNYWSNNNNSDADHDGYADTPYLIDGSAGNVDSLPLAHPIKYPVYVLYPPVFITPSNGFVISNSVKITWNPDKDTFNHTFQYSLEYKANQDNSYTIIASGINTTSYTWDTSLLTNGNYSIKLNAYYKTYSNSTSINIIINNSKTPTTPTVTTTSSATSSSSPTISVNSPGFNGFLLIFALLGLVIIKQKRKKD